MTQRLRFFLPAIAAFLLFIIAAAIVFVQPGRMLFKERLFNELLISVKNINGMINTFIEGKKGRVLDFCSDGIIKDGLTYYDPDAADVDGLVKQINHHLSKNKLVLDPYLESIMVLNLKGKVVFSTDEKLLGKDQPQEDCFRELSRYFKDKRPRTQELNLLVYAGDVSASDGASGASFCVSAIVTARTTGLALGAVVNRYKANVLSKFVKMGEDYLGGSGKIYMLNKDGLLLTAPKYFSVQGKEVILKKRITALPSGLPVIVAQTGLPAGRQAGPQILGIYKDFRGVSVLGAAMLMDINDWLVIAEKDAGPVIITGLIIFLILIAVSALIINLQKRIRKKSKEAEEAKNQLYQSGKMAAVGQLSGSIAHEINNPLTGVLNNIQLLKMMLADGKGFNPEAIKPILDTAEESASRCANISRSLLDFSHMADGKFHPLCLNEAIEKVTTIIGNEMKQYNIFIEKRLHPGRPVVRGEIQLLQQVIFDLINNAKYAIQRNPKAKVGMITIKTDFDPEKKKAYLYISDNGIGISKENMEKLFTPFFTTKPAGEGTGLGLSIIHSIITRHNASISVESKAGRGTTFKITLPCLPAGLPTAGRQASLSGGD